MLDNVTPSQTGYHRSLARQVLKCQTFMFPQRTRVFAYPERRHPITAYVTCKASSLGESRLLGGMQNSTMRLILPTPHTHCTSQIGIR